VPRGLFPALISSTTNYRKFWSSQDYPNLSCIQPSLFPSPFPFQCSPSNSKMFFHDIYIQFNYNWLHLAPNPCTKSTFQIKMKTRIYTSRRRRICWRWARTESLAPVSCSEVPLHAARRIDEAACAPLLGWARRPELTAPVDGRGTPSCRS
jgi:hypothetical protein